ncbi:hypothetical protein FQA39_LY12237 [Lamprigera yunnana]|nr:hypothetical protein FQA39_LY12237 [Lamprigera yunnana]
MEECGIFRLVIEKDNVRLGWDTWIRRNLQGVNESTVHVITTLGAGNLEYFFWRAIGKGLSEATVDAVTDIGKQLVCSIAFRELIMMILHPRIGMINAYALHPLINVFP